MKKQILVSGCFNKDAQEKLEKISKDFNKYNITLSVRNYQEVPLDCFDSEDCIAAAYELIRFFVQSGIYDWFKYKLISIWNSGYTHKKFTLSIKGIPLNDGSENIKVTASGELSDEQKNAMIDKTYELANKIIDKEYELKERNQFYQAMQTHPFIFNSSDNTLTEVDTAEEIYKRAKKNRD